MTPKEKMKFLESRIAELLTDVHSITVVDAYAIARFGRKILDPHYKVTLLECINATIESNWLFLMALSHENDTGAIAYFIRKRFEKFHPSPLLVVQRDDEELGDENKVSSAVN